jgi:uncharacterized membrane protein
MEQQKRRYIYIDLLRGWAVLVMIEVHVVNAFLLPEIRQEGWFTVLNFINGLVAPAFLFVSGYSFVIVAQRKWNDYLNRTPVFWKQIGRIAQILAVGYALHLPVFSFTKLTQIGREEWSVFWKVDILHTIAVSLLTMVVLILFMGNQKKYFISVIVLACIMVFGSPMIYDRNIDHLLPEQIADYFTAAHRSQFPLFPWMGFVLAGGITAQLWVWWKERIEEQKIFLRFSIAAAALILLSVIIDVLPFSIYPEHNYWKANPGFFFIRLGIVIILLAALWYWEKVYRSGKSIVSVVGSESLVAYAGHLLVIYGLFFNNHSLAFLIGKTRTIPEAAAMTAGLAAATVLASYVWHSIKNWSMFYARVLMYSILIVVLYIFVTKPY